MGIKMPKYACGGQRTAYVLPVPGGFQGSDSVIVRLGSEPLPIKPSQWWLNGKGLAGLLPLLSCWYYPVVNVNVQVG